MCRRRSARRPRRHRRCRRRRSPCATSWAFWTRRPPPRDAVTCRSPSRMSSLPLSIDAAAQGLADVLQLPNPPPVDPVSAAAMRRLAVGSNPSSCSAHVRLAPAHLFLCLCHTRTPPSSSTALDPPGSISAPHCVVVLVGTRVVVVPSYLTAADPLEPISEVSPSPPRFLYLQLRIGSVMDVTGSKSMQDVMTIQIPEFDILNDILKISGSKFQPTKFSNITGKSLCKGTFNTRFESGSWALKDRDCLFSDFSSAPQSGSPDQYRTSSIFKYYSS